MINYNYKYSNELPDAFTFTNGNRVTSKDDWIKRADELKLLFEKYIYGSLPNNNEDVTFEMKKPWIKITVSNKGKKTSFPIKVFYPQGYSDNEGVKQFPVLITLLDLAPEFIKIANDRGYIVVEMYTDSIATDDINRTGSFYDLYPYSAEKYDVGVLRAWAWGVSRIIDIIEMNAIDQAQSNHIIVMGISRWGKAALLSGAFDSRIAVTNPCCSGILGMASFNTNYSGKQYPWGISERSETIPDIIESFPHWTNSYFHTIREPKDLPIDQHQLAALCAPRYLLVSGSYEDYWTSPEGMYDSYLEAKKVFKFLGVEEHIEFAFRMGEHKVYEEDVINLLDFCDYHLLNKKNIKKFNKCLFREPL